MHLNKKAPPISSPPQLLLLNFSNILYKLSISCALTKHGKDKFLEKIDIKRTFKDKININGQGY